VCVYRDMWFGSFVPSKFSHVKVWSFWSIPFTLSKFIDVITFYQWLHLYDQFHLFEGGIVSFSQSFSCYSFFSLSPFPFPFLMSFSLLKLLSYHLFISHYKNGPSSLFTLCKHLFSRCLIFIKWYFPLELEHIIYLTLMCITLIIAQFRGKHNYKSPMLCKNLKLVSLRLFEWTFP
jgi:hypothetical protein